MRTCAYFVGVVQHHSGEDGHRLSRIDAFEQLPSFRHSLPQCFELAF